MVNPLHPYPPGSHIWETYTWIIQPWSTVITLSHKPRTSLPMHHPAKRTLSSYQVPSWHREGNSPSSCCGREGESWLCLGAACSSLGSIRSTQPDAASLPTPTTPQIQHREGLRFTKECPSLSFSTMTYHMDQSRPSFPRTPEAGCDALSITSTTGNSKQSNI